MTDTKTINRRIVLASRPIGAPVPEDFRLEEADRPSPVDGQLLLRNLYLSLDPYMRGRMSEGPSYAKPVGLGEVMGGATVSRVETSRHADFQEGDLVVGFGNWQDLTIGTREGASTSTGCVSVSSSFGAFELLTRFDTGHRGSTPLAAGGHPSVTRVMALPAKSQQFQQSCFLSNRATLLQRAASMRGITMAMGLDRIGARSPAPSAAEPDTSSDEVLVGRIAAGDQLAMRTLFCRHRIALYRWLLRLVDEEHLAEDLLSEVFLDVWRQAASFEARSSVSTWLLAIARYKGLRSRRRRRIDVELDDELVSTLKDPADDPERVLQKKNRAEVLRQFLARLSPEHGEVIDLAYYHGKSVKEIAEITGIKEATVKTRMYYGRRNLAELVATA